MLWNHFSFAGHHPLYNCALALACISRGLNILHSTLSCIFLFHIFVTFLRRDSNGGGGAPPPPPVNPPLLRQNSLQSPTVFTFSWRSPSRRFHRSRKNGKSAFLPSRRVTLLRCRSVSVDHRTESTATLNVFRARRRILRDVITPLIQWRHGIPCRREDMAARG